MNLWLAMGGLTLVAVLPILWPLLRPSKRANDRLDHDLEVYRDQLREVDAELASNALTDREAGEARREIERRILRAADHGNSSAGPGAPSALTAVLIALLLPALTVLLYTQLGQPGQPNQPLAQRNLASQPEPQPLQGLTEDQNEQVNEMVARLETRLQEQPDDLDGWVLLGRSQSALGRYGEAANALRRALALSGNDVNLLVALGDILTKSARGRVTPEALAAIGKAQKLAPNHMGARYMLALADLQAGRPQKAYDSWLMLYREMPQDSDNRRALAEQIRRVAQELRIDPESELNKASTIPGRSADAPAPGPDRAAMAAAANLSAGDRQEFIQSMVQRLASRLKDEPGDFDGWMRLGKAYGVLKRTSDSAKAYGNAAALRPGDPNPLNAQATALIEGAAPDQKLPEAALAVLRQLEMLQPDNPRALWFLGMADAGKGRRVEAKARWQRLYDQLPENSQERTNLKAAIDGLRDAK